MIHSMRVSLAIIQHPLDTDHSLPGYKYIFIYLEVEEKKTVLQTNLRRSSMPVHLTQVR